MKKFIQEKNPLVAQYVGKDLFKKVILRNTKESTHRTNQMFDSLFPYLLGALVELLLSLHPTLKS